MEADAVILAGGGSRRMGGFHKGNLKLGELTFTQRLIQQLAPQTNRIYLSCGENTPTDVPNCQIVRDEYSDCGPMGGLHASLKRCESDLLLVAACDTPLLTMEFYRYLCTFLGEHDGVVAVVNGRMQPLAAVYTKRLLPVFEACLREGNYRLRDALAQANICYVELSDQPTLCAMLQNINTPQEYEQLLQQRAEL